MSTPQNVLHFGIRVHIYMIAMPVFMIASRAPAADTRARTASASLITARDIYAITTQGLEVVRVCVCVLS